MYPPLTRNSPRGFTLIELLIVVAIIAIIAAVAIPNLLSSRLTANESSAISTLRTIVSAQAQAQSRSSCDNDGDGQGESLYLAELSGTVNLRGMGVSLDPAVVSVSLGRVANSAVNKAGYFFAMFLPDPAGTGVPEDPNGGKAAPGAIGADLAEVFWACYAWPANNGSSGRRAFLVNQSGDLLQTDNSVQAYAGSAAAPAADAAYSAAGDMTAPVSLGGAPAPAQDGGTWITVN
ncbi:MAG: prepilin-type N-terminal cleavage/methylation domain-containing protein [Planctomycetota bacterium]